MKHTIQNTERTEEVKVLCTVFYKVFKREITRRFVESKRVLFQLGVILQMIPIRSSISSQVLQILFSNHLFN